MARLGSSSDTRKGQARTGFNAVIIDKLLAGMQTDQRKRSRPVTNSLEYKIANPGKYVVPPRLSQQSKTSSETTTEQPQPRVVPTVTRAQRSGLPPRKLELSDLEGMDEQQIIQALQDDPELAEAAAEEAAKLTSDKARSDRMIKDPGDRVDLDKGFPFVQWIVVLVLLAAGLYQLYKTLSGPASPKKGPAPTKKISKGKKTAPRMRGKGADKPATKEDDDLVEKVVAEIEDAVEGPKPHTKKKQASKKKNKSKAVAKPTAKAKATQSPDTAATDDSSTSEAAVQPDLNGSNTTAKSDPTVPLNRPIVTESVAEDDGNGWQTVGAKPSASTISKENAPPQQAASQPAPSTETAELKAPVSDNDTGKKKKKKKKATATPPLAAEPETPLSDTPAAKPAELEPTNGDAALARQLQEEEDLIAADHGEDEWAEVTKKKRAKA